MLLVYLGSVALGVLRSISLAYIIHLFQMNFAVISLVQSILAKAREKEHYWKRITPSPLAISFV